LAHLLKYDSILGNLTATIEAGDDWISVNGDKFQVLSQKDPAALPWKDLGVEVVFEGTGKFTKKEDAAKHIAAGAKRVIITAPATGPDGTFVMGVNHDQYDPARHAVISNASCTTNCLAPFAKVLNDNFGIVRGWMTTIHAYTNDQNLLDLPHKDLRRARAAAMSMIPTTTGAAKAVGEVLPALKGKLDGFAMRVPTPNVSVVDLAVIVSKKTTGDEVNAAFKAAAAGPLKGILAVEEAPLVSIDFRKNANSSIVDAAYTNDQNLLDLPHKDLRRARAAALSMIPTTTGAAKAVGEVLPDLKGKLDGFAMRVPTPNVSVVDLAVLVGKATTADEINAAFRAAAAGTLKGILAVEDAPLVSIDFRANSNSSIVDSAYTKVMGGDFVKVLSWYDNEWGYSCRCVDLVRYMAEKGL
jgi:glyceraldehyde 3-phosphate dehydrogenase